MKLQSFATWISEIQHTSGPPTTQKKKEKRELGDFLFFFIFTKSGKMDPLQLTTFVWLIFDSLTLALKKGALLDSLKKENGWLSIFFSFFLFYFFLKIFFFFCSNFSRFPFLCIFSLIPKSVTRVFFNFGLFIFFLNY